MRKDSEGNPRGTTSALKLNAVALTILLGTLLSLVPLWIVRYPPLLDYPNHLAIAFVLDHLKDPTMDLQQHYRADWGLYPYVLAYVLLIGLQKFLAIEIAGKVVLSLCVISVPLATWYFLRQANPGQDAQVIWCLLIAYTPFLLSGFISFQLGIGVCFLVLGLWLRYQSQPRLWLWLLVLFLAVTLYFTHLVGFLVAALVVAMYWLVARRTFREALLWGTWFVPGVLFSILRERQPLLAETWGPLHIAGPIEKMIRLKSAVVGYSHPINIMVLALIVMALLISWPRNCMFGWNRPWLGVTAAMLLMYAVTPTVGLADMRLTVFLFVLGLAALKTGERGRKLAGLGVLAVALHGGNVAWTFHKYQQSLAPLDRGIDVIPARARVLPLVHTPLGEPNERSPYANFWAYGVIRKQWFSPYLLQTQGVSPFKVIDRAYRPELNLRDFGQAIEWQRVRQDFDYVWTQNAPDLLPGLNKIAEPVFHEGEFWIYRVEKGSGAWNREKPTLLASGPHTPIVRPDRDFDEYIGCPTWGNSGDC